MTIKLLQEVLNIVKYLEIEYSKEFKIRYSFIRITKK